MVRILALVILLALVACGPTPGPTEAPPGPIEAPPEPAAEETGEETWENPYETSPAELCPPDGETVGQPIFGELVEAEELWLQRGLFANEQGELFSVTVAGLNPETVAEYTAVARVCFDMIPSGRMASEPGASQPEEEVPKEAEPSPDDLFITIDFVASGPLEEAQDVAQELSVEPVEVWESWLKERDWTTEGAEQGYVLDFIIDPPICNGCRHQYVERKGCRAWVNLSVAGGGGSVIAGLCKSGSTYPYARRTVTHGGTETASMSHQSAVNITYDLGVRGRQSSNTYRISGRWGWVGWYAGYSSSAPNPRYSSWNCNP